jgi:putative methyltransferase (TIGR04325 family)
MSRFQNIAIDWLPPKLVQLFRRFRLKSWYCGPYSSWNAALADSSGYDSELILARALQGTLIAMENEYSYERDGIVFNDGQYSWPILCGLLWVSARDGRLDVLDFGGSLGGTYLQHKKFFNSMTNVVWNIIEQDHVVDAAKKYINYKPLNFYTQIANCMKESNPNAVLFSSVLQYLDKPEMIVSELQTVNAKYLIIDRTPINNEELNKVFVQRVPPNIYDASYPVNIFSKKYFLEVLFSEWTLIASGQSPEGVVIAEDGTEISFEWFIMEKLSAKKV